MMIMIISLTQVQVILLTNGYIQYGIVSLQLSQLWYAPFTVHTLPWRHNKWSAMTSQITGVSNGLLNRLFIRRSKETSKIRVTSLFEGNSPATVEFPGQRASNAEH